MDDGFYSNSTRSMKKDKYKRSDGRRRIYCMKSRWTVCRSKKCECVCVCTCGCGSSNDSDSDSVDTVVCNKNYRAYMCTSVCSSSSDSDVTEYHNSNLEYKLYQSVLQTFGRDATYKYMPDIESEDAYSNTMDDTDVDDYKIIGRYTTSDTCARTRPSSLTSMQQRVNGG
jgi:hypothetical protein